MSDPLTVTGGNVEFVRPGATTLGDVTAAFAALVGEYGIPADVEIVSLQIINLAASDLGRAESRFHVAWRSGPRRSKPLDVQL